MIKNKAQLKEYIKADRRYYMSFPKKRRIRLAVSGDHLYKIQKFMKLLRHEEFYYNRKGAYNRIMELFYARRKNRLGNKLGFYIRPDSLGKGATIFHHGSVIIHGDAVLGENCKLHGENCVGNNGGTNDAPVIGKNVDIGVGASILGNVKIADDVKIGAGAVVVKSCETKGATLVGIPAKEINR